MYKTRKQDSRVSKNRLPKFNVLNFALQIIKQFDSKAFIRHSRDTGEPVIYYRHKTGKRLVVGHGEKAKLVYTHSCHELTEKQAMQMVRDLGQL